MGDDLGKCPFGKVHSQASRVLNVIVDCPSTEKRLCIDDFEVKETTREILLPTIEIREAIGVASVCSCFGVRFRGFSASGGSRELERESLH